MPGDGVGQLDEELAHARFLQEGAEEDEQEDEGGGSAYRGAEDALRGIEQVLDDEPGAEPAVAQEAGHRPAEVADQDEDAGDDHDGQAHHAPAALQQQQDGDAADPQLIQLQAVLGHDLAEKHHRVQIEADRHQAQNDIPPGQRILPGPLAHRVQQKAQQHHDAHVHRAHVRRRDHLPGAVQLQQRKQHAHRGDDGAAPVRQGAVGALPVVLAHDLVDLFLRHLLDLQGVMLPGRHGMVGFLVFAHVCSLASTGRGRFRTEAQSSRGGGTSPPDHRDKVI